MHVQCTSCIAHTCKYCTTASGSYTTVCVCLQVRLLKKLRKIWKDFSVCSGVDYNGEITREIESKHGNQGMWWVGGRGGQMDGYYWRILLADMIGGCDWRM